MRAEAAVMAKMTPEQEASYALDWDLPRSDLSMAAQLEYDRLSRERKAAGLALSLASRTSCENLMSYSFSVSLHFNCEP